MRVPNQGYVDVSHFRAPYKDSTIDGGGDSYSAEDEMNGFGVYTGYGSAFGDEPATPDVAAQPPPSSSRDAVIFLDGTLLPPGADGVRPQVAVIVPSDAASYLDTLSAMGVLSVSSAAVTTTGAATAATLAPAGKTVAGQPSAQAWVFQQARLGNYVLAPRTYNPFLDGQALIASQAPDVIAQLAGPTSHLGVLQAPIAAPAPVITGAPPSTQVNTAGMSPGKWALVALAAAGAYYWWKQPKSRAAYTSNRRRSRRARR